MENIEIKKHWWYWIKYAILIIITAFIIRALILDFVLPMFINWIIPLLILLYGYLRWSLDKIEIKDNCIYSRIGIIFIDKKTIPIEKISFISEKCNIFSELLNFASIEIQCSAFAKKITYPYISNPQEIIKLINNCKDLNNRKD